MATMQAGKLASPSIHMTRSLPLQSKAGDMIARTIAPELHFARSIGMFASTIKSQLNTTVGREALRNGVDLVKDGLGFAKDVAEHAEHFTHSAGQGAHALAALPKHFSAVTQLSFDVARMKAEIHLAKLAALGGSSASASALAFMRPMLSQSEAMLANEKSMQHGYMMLVREYGGIAQSRLGKLALATEDVISKSKIGRSILDHGKIISDPALGRFLVGVGGASAAWKAYENSPLKSKVGKIVHAGVSGAMAIGTDVAVGMSNPFASLFDPVVKYGAKALGHEKEGDSLTFGKWAEGTANVYMAIGQSLWTHDSAPLDMIHKRNMSGENGRVLQGYSMIGEQLADVMDPMITKIVDWSHDAPTGFTKSRCWWGH